MRSQLWVVLAKELRDALRDKRSLLPLLIAPLLGPLVVALAFTQVIEQSAPEARLELPVAGAAHAPELVAHLQRSGVSIVAAPADPAAAVREGRAALVLVVPPDYGERFQRGGTAAVELVVDSARHDTAGARARVLALLHGHSRLLGRQRLLARGISPTVAEPIEVREMDLATPRKQAAFFLEMLPMFVLIASFVGGVQLATDATAGERERGSLEPLLIAPVVRRALVMGKWLAACALSAVTAVLTMIYTLTALSFVPAERIGLSLTLSRAEMAGALLAMLPLSLLFPAVQILVASFARTVREAQTYLSFAIFVPMLPALLTTLAAVDVAPWMAAVPVLGQQVLLTSMIRGESLGVAGHVLAGASALAAALACVQLTAWLFRRERIIYGR